MLKKVSCKKRLPKKEGLYFVEYGHNEFESTCFFNGKRFEVGEFTVISFWYDKIKRKPKKDLKKFAKKVLKVFEKANKGFPVSWAGFKNGEGEDCGEDIDSLIFAARKIVSI